MSETHSITPQGQTFSLVPYPPSPSITPPSSPSSSAPAAVDVTYRIVCIKHPDTDWLMPSPSDLVQITGPVSWHDTTISDDEKAAAEEDDRLEIPCAAHVTWGDRSIHLNCLYHLSAALFTDVGECTDATPNMTNKADPVNSVGITMQNAILSGKGKGGEMTEDEDTRDDNGNPFMVLHVNKGLGASARLYCKKVPYGQMSLTGGFAENLAATKSGEGLGDSMDYVATVKADSLPIPQVPFGMSA